MVKFQNMSIVYSMYVFILIYMNYFLRKSPAVLTRCVFSGDVLGGGDAGVPQHLRPRHGAPQPTRLARQLPGIYHSIINIEKIFNININLQYMNELLVLGKT